MSAVQPVVIPPCTLELFSLACVTLPSFAAPALILLRSMLCERSPILMPRPDSVYLDWLNASATHGSTAQLGQNRLRRRGGETVRPYWLRDHAETTPIGTTPTETTVLSNNGRRHRASLRTRNDTTDRRHSPSAWKTPTPRRSSIRGRPRAVRRRVTAGTDVAFARPSQWKHSPSGFVRPSEMPRGAKRSVTWTSECQRSVRGSGVEQLAQATVDPPSWVGRQA